MIRDKDLFVSGTDENSVSQEDIALAESNKDTSATVTPEAPIEAPATTEPVVTTEVPATPEEPATPMDTPVTPEVPAEPTAPEGQKEKSISEILDELDASFAKQEETAKEIAKTGEEIKAADTAGKDTTELIDKLNKQIAEDEAEKRKLGFTVDFLKTQNENLTKENLGFKYGRVDEEGILGLINNDPGIKDIISSTIKAQGGNPSDKEKLINSYKTQLETLTGLDFSEFINTSKQKIESENTASETDVAMNMDTGKDGESMFV